MYFPPKATNVSSLGWMAQEVILKIFDVDTCPHLD
jgi:hypothetical protein